ncbi:hypothetical protein MiSe_49130 [Microseira wollei NIES-4236]|uniref:Uncharacterized protein n=1 Tax=Microseira wollei NIES-4236 TaxID=2530354 RepID=A0AAV3XIY7_9CYAN|nr:hypothetical protein MiSe_49130 [Microseira wollei NIES-4236]
MRLQSVILTNWMLLPLKLTRLESESITLTLRRSVMVDTLKRRRLCDRDKPLFTDSKLILNITLLLLNICGLFMFI